MWCVDYVRANEFLPDALRAILSEEGSETFTAEMLGRAAGTLRDFDALAASAFLVFFEPPSLDERIVNQFALFSLLSDPVMPLERWLEAHPEVVRKIVVPAALKWEIRDKLDQANITERVLYPGLDGLGRWLTRYYTPRRRDASPAGSGPLFDASGGGSSAPVAPARADSDRSSRTVPGDGGPRE